MSEEERISDEAESNATGQGALARRREAMLKRRQSNNGEGDESILRRRMEALAQKQSKIAAEASMENVKDHTHDVFEELARCFIPAELDLRGGFANRNLYTNTYKFITPEDELVLKLLCLTTKHTVVRVTQQESRLRNPASLAFDVRILPLMGCMLSKSAPSSAYENAISSANAKSEALANNDLKSYRQQYLSGGAPPAKSLKQQIKDMAAKVKLISSYKEVESFPWEWTLQVGGAFGMLGLKQGRGESMPAYTHQIILRYGEDESVSTVIDEDQDSESVTTVTTALENQSILTDLPDVHEEFDEEDEEDSDLEDAGPTSSTVDIKASSSPNANVSKGNASPTTSLVSAGSPTPNAAVATNNESAKNGSKDNSPSQEGARAARRKRREAFLNSEDAFNCEDTDSSDSEDSEELEFPPTDGEAPQQTLDINNVLDSRWLRSESLTAALENRRRLSWPNITAWVSQMLQTLQWVHQHYAVFGHFTIDDVILLPDMAVAVAVKSTVAQSKYEYRGQIQSWMSRAQQVKYKRQLERWKKGTTARHAWIDPRPWLASCEVQSKRAQSPTASARSPSPPKNRSASDSSGNALVPMTQSAEDIRPTMSYTLHRGAVFTQLEAMDPKWEGKVLVEKDPTQDARTKQREESVLTELQKMRHSMQKDYKCLGVIVLQLLLRRPLQEFENKRVWHPRFNVVQLSEFVDLEAYNKGGEQVQKLCALLKLCFTSFPDIESEPARKRGNTIGKYFWLTLPRMYDDILINMLSVVKEYEENRAWRKKRAKRHKDVRRLARQTEIKQKYYATHQERGPNMAASRILDEKKKIWFEMLSIEQQRKIKHKEKMQKVSEQRRLDRIHWMHEATFHHWDQSAFRRWVHEAVVLYLRKAWCVRRPTLSNKSIRLNEIVKEQVGEALAAVEFQKYSLVKRLLHHHGFISALANAELRGVHATNFEIDNDIEKAFVTLGKDIAHVLSTNSSAMEVCKWLEEAIQLSRSKLEKTGMVSILSAIQYQHKKTQFECDFFIKFFPDYLELLDVYVDGLGYSRQTMTAQEFRQASPEAQQEQIQYNKSRDALLASLARSITYAMFEKYHATKWLRDKGLDIAASKMIAGYRRMKVMKIMNRVWRKVLDEHGDLLAEEEERKKQMLAEKAAEPVKVLLKTIERVKERLVPPQLKNVVVAVTQRDYSSDGRSQFIQGSLDVTLTAHLQQSCFGLFKQKRLKELCCLAAVVLQPPPLPSPDLIAEHRDAVEANKYSLRELAAKRKKQQALYEGEVVLIMHDSRDVFKWLNQEVSDRVFEACMQYAATRREALIQELSAEQLLPFEDYLSLPLPSLERPEPCPAEVLSVTAPTPVPRRGPREETSKASAITVLEGPINSALAKANADIDALNKASADLSSAEPNTLVVRVGGLQGFSRYRVRVFCSSLLSPVQPHRRNASAWMIRSTGIPAACCLSEKDVNALVTWYDRREEELIAKGKQRLSSGDGPGDDLDNIVDLEKNAFLDMHWTLVGQTSPTSPFPPLNLSSQVVSIIDTTAAAGSSRDATLSNEDFEIEELDWGIRAELRDKVNALPKVQSCTGLNHVQSIQYKPNAYTGGDAVRLFRIARCLSVEVQTNSTSGLFPMGAAAEDRDGASDIHQSQPRIWQRKSAWRLVRDVSPQEDGVISSNGISDVQDTLSSQDLLSFLHKAIELPEGLLNPATGGIGHWRYNTMPSQVFNRKEALECAHFVISVQYRVRAINRYGSSRWTYSMLCPLTTVVPDQMPRPKYPVMSLPRPYVDNTSFAKRHLLHFSEYMISNMRDYSELIVKPIEVPTGGLGLLLNSGGESRPNTGGAPAATSRVYFAQDPNANVHSNVPEYGQEDSIVPQEQNRLFHEGSTDTNEDEELSWLMKVSAAKPEIRDIKRD